MGDVLAIRKEAVAAPLRLDVADGIATVVLDNPPANALTMEMLGLLQAALDAIGGDKAARVVVIEARGKLFSGGHDLKEMTAHRADADGGRAFYEQILAACATMMQGIVHLPKPVIAKVDGIATAAGCQLVASCDLAIASERSRFGVNGIDVGLFCHTPAVALSRKVKPKHAMEMLLTGELIDAATAREFGLVNRVVPAEYLDQVVAKYASTIAAKSPAALAMGKRSFYAQAELGLAAAYDLAGKAILENLMAPDAREGISAFAGKRKPEWKQD